MDYEKAYKEALERAKSKIKNNKDHVLYEDDIIEMFQELKESEDERTRKAILDCFITMKKQGCFPAKHKEQYESWIAWLEKQEEQKQDPCKECDFPKLNCENFPCINKKAFEQGKSVFDIPNEPKFKVGDWVVDKESKEVFNISKNLANTYEIIDIEGNDYHVPHYTVDKDYHLWTIQDTKAGDVLADEYNNIGLYRGEKDDFWESYIYLGCDNNLYGFNIGGYHEHKNTKPATKEQRDLLFQKMKEAGYEWDADKKKLGKLVIDEGKAEMDYCFTKMMNGEKVSSAWSEEDEKAINDIMWIIEAYRKNGFNESHKQAANNAEKWLKSLKPQPQWKPNEDEMKALDWALSLAKNCGEECAFDLRTLLEQLKKLREE